MPMSTRLRATLFIIGGKTRTKLREYILPVVFYSIFIIIIIIIIVIIR
jgi:hypothetical protein